MITDFAGQPLEPCPNPTCGTTEHRFTSIDEAKSQVLKCKVCGRTGEGVALYYVGGQGYLPFCIADHEIGHGGCKVK